MSSNQVNSQPEMETEAQAAVDVEVEPEVLSRASVASSVEETAPSTSQSPSGKSTEAPLTGCVVRIKRELQDIRKNPPPNCSADLHHGDLLHWTAGVNGPVGSVYEGGHFRLDIRFPASYPFRAPRIRFTTRIYHCNVDSRGAICLDVLGERWSPVMNVAKVLLSIYVLMSECNPDDPLVMCIADQYKTNRREHDKIARHWTKLFAMTKAQDKNREKDADQRNEQNQEESSMPGQQGN
ncbi:ubiquitin-conjugating enzyme E2-17 kDa isoform X1 [Drosophila sechellia]|uniref:GM11560 n=1 Tax=Drosophila sechellia TaxID=7238 RepID=B4IGF2_DROSE|nr:ubiquitin-conjugating enzyme E2-17 kDa isoform X1 [Drosophila sechellia]EDW48902.1 GM11560 [Drosophila sechellia]